MFSGHLQLAIDELAVVLSFHHHLEIDVTLGPT